MEPPQVQPETIEQLLAEIVLQRNEAELDHLKALQAIDVQQRKLLVEQTRAVLRKMRAEAKIAEVVLQENKEALEHNRDMRAMLKKDATKTEIN